MFYNLNQQLQKIWLLLILSQLYIFLTYVFSLFSGVSNFQINHPGLPQIKPPEVIYLIEKEQYYSQNLGPCFMIRISHYGDM